MNDLVTVKEAADHLRISNRTVYRLIEAGEIAAVRIGKQWRIPRVEMPGSEVPPLTVSGELTPKSA